MEVRNSQNRQHQRPASDAWLLAGVGIAFYLILHTLQTMFLGFPPEFKGREHEAMRAFSSMLGIALLPTLLGTLGRTKFVSYAVLVSGSISFLLMTLIAWQYGIKSGATYIALAILVFVLVPQAVGLKRSFVHARGL